MGSAEYWRAVKSNAYYKRDNFVHNLEIKRSPAGNACLCRNDVIIRCDGNSIGSPLELTEALWNKEGKPVELIVIRPRIGQLKLTVTVGTCPKTKRWHVLHVGFLWILKDRLAMERKDKSLSWGNKRLLDFNEKFVKFSSIEKCA